MTAKEAMKKVFRFSGEEKAKIIISLQKLNAAIPSAKNQGQIKKLQALKSEGLIDDSVYRQALQKIRAQNNGFDEDTLKKLQYYKNVIATLISALQ